MPAIKGKSPFESRILHNSRKSRKKIQESPRFKKIHTEFVENVERNFIEFSAMKYFSIKFLAIGKALISQKKYKIYSFFFYLFYKSAPAAPSGDSASLPMIHHQGEKTIFIIPKTVSLHKDKLS